MFNLFKKSHKVTTTVHTVEWCDFRSPSTIYKDTMTDRGIGNCIVNDPYFVLVSIDGEKVEGKC